MRLVDADGDDVLVGDSGEIWVAGPNVFQGYWNDPEATAAALTADGWLRTGDIAVVDDDGYLFLVDRVKDLIIVSGFNVYPAEVEEVLLEHPAVEACAVVGVPHPYSGEAVKAYVVVRAGRVGRGGRDHRVLRRAPRPVQVPREGDVRRRDPARHRRQGPPPQPRVVGAGQRQRRARSTCERPACE